MRAKKYDKLKTLLYSDRVEMGAAAGAQAAKLLRSTIEEKSSARIVVASAPSQVEMLSRLVSEEGIDWSRVTVFHMDEYIGLPDTHQSSFRAFQYEYLLSRVTPRAFHGIRGEAPEPELEIERYSRLFNEAPIDIVCMGIGENGHIAFNDPPVADFDDKATIKVVQLDLACRQQQVNDGCFPCLEEVPSHAFSLTCPALTSARHIICTVPGELKAGAVKRTLLDPISTTCPASILRTHADATLFVDQAALALTLES